MKAFHFNFLFIVLFISSSLFADRITVHNRTPRSLYVAIYYLPMKLPWEKIQMPAKRMTKIQFLETESSGIMQRPSRKVGYDRELVFVEDKELLKPELSKQELINYHSKNVGDLQGDVFYIGDKEAEFYGYTTIEWNVVKSILDEAHKKVMSALPEIVNNPYKNKYAQVRTGNELSSGEKAYLLRRMPKVKAHLEKLLGSSLDGKYVPKIALVCSGGGYRSMLFATGALLGAQKSGIFDAATYMVGLSGSTWAIGGWLLSNKSLQSYHDWLLNNINFGLRNVTLNDAKLISNYFITKYFYDERFDIVDLYGCLLANELFTEFGNKKQMQTLSSQIKKVETATIPFPIYTAIAAESMGAEQIWYEFNPWEIGAPKFSAYVPSWAFGRRFKNGISVNFAPEQNFGVLLGTFGLAIGITLNRVVDEIGLKEKIPTLFAKNIIDRILQEHGERRITTSDFFNFTFGFSNNVRAQHRVLRLVDAGINFNLPYPAISGERVERKADIIIFIDSTGDNLTTDLRKAEEYARKRNLRFPAIDYSSLETKSVSVFRHEQDPQVPLVIYIPRIVDRALFANPKLAQLTQDFQHIRNYDIEACVKSGPCATFNFNYTSEQARRIANLGELNMLAARETILQAIEWKINRMSGNGPTV